MKLKLLLTIFALGLITCAANAQEASTYTKAFSVNPLYLKNSGIRFNYEQQIRASRHWFYVSPMIFYANDTKLTDEVTGNLFSYGAEFGAIYKFDRENDVFGIYVQYGALVRQTTLSYAGVVWTRTLVDDLTYMELKEQNLKKNLNQFGLVATLGYKSKFANSMFIDCYVGICGRYSTINFDYTNDGVNLDSSPWNLGYSGLGSVLGLSLGTYF